MARRRSNRRSNRSDLRQIEGIFRGLPRGMQFFLGALLLVGVVVAAVFYRPELGGGGRPPVSSPPSSQFDVAAATRVHLFLGNPSGATTDPADRDDYLIVRPAYALSYNNGTGTPNWVSWRIVNADFGDAPRSADFLPDPLLPESFKRVTHRDYTGSGFDRGHMCPKADRDGSDELSASTFLTTNIVPQSPDLNQNAWNNLEEYSRTLAAREGKRLYVVSGPHGRGGVGREGFRETIADGKVVVPAECWKVVLVLDDTGKTFDDPADVPASARVIAVVMPNTQAAGDDWTKYRTSVAAVEQKTGYRFFTGLPPDVADALRQQVDAVPVPPPEPRRYGR